MRSLLALLALLFVATPSAEAQIIAVYFKSDKVAKKYKKHLVEWNGQPCVVGEPMKGIKIEGGQIQYAGDGPNELYVADPSKPEDPAYYFLDGEKHPSSKKNRLVIQGAHVEGIAVMMRDESLAGLSKEYTLRMAQVDEFRDDRDRFEKGTVEWNSRHARLVSALEKMRMWLEATAFPGALKRIDKSLKKEQKYATGHIEARAEKALDSIKEMEVPEALTRLAADKFGGAHNFRAMESQHIRFYYIDEITDEQVRQALLLGEEVIEGFRNTFIDPYISETYIDNIPDTVFQEFFFVPDTDEAYEGYSNGFWNIDWSRDREERLKIGGNSSIGMGQFRNCRRNRDIDLPGVICHTLGHSIASLHYGGGKIQFLPQDWISEALGYHISFEHLGRNTVTCKAFHHDTPGYVKREFEEKEEGEKSIGTGRRDTYNEIALQFGRPIDQLALRELYEMDDADLAKSWSFFDYVLRKEGFEGQLWLQAAGKYASNKQTFIEKWREAAAQALGVTPREAFRDVEGRWREFATNGQDTSENAGKRGGR
jgi:hypothetical protein